MTDQAAVVKTAKTPEPPVKAEDAKPPRPAIPGPVKPPALEATPIKLPPPATDAAAVVKTVVPLEFVPGAVIQGHDQGYELLAKIGNGGFADVWKARKQSNGLEVAIKRSAHDQRRA